MPFFNIKYAPVVEWNNKTFLKSNMQVQILSGVPINGMLTFSKSGSVSLCKSKVYLPYLRAANREYASRKNRPERNQGGES